MLPAITTNPVIPAAFRLTISSLALLELINQRRAEFGEVEARRNHFHDRVRDELEGEHYQILVVTNPNGTQSEEFYLSLDQCMLVAMRESKGVRRQVQAKLRDAQAPAIDLNNPEHLRGLLSSYAEKAIELKSQLDHAIKTKSQIGDKKVATAMATASAAKRETEKLKDQLGFNTRHATVIAVESASGKRFDKQDWRPLKAWCKGNGAVSVTVPCARYGKAQAWPAGAWGAVYGVDLVELFGEVAA